MKTIIQNIFKTFALLTVYCVLNTAHAQAPNKFSYQAVIRNASNVIVAGIPVGMRVSILQTTATGTAIYVETHNPTTNANGLASVEIGGGTLVSGNFATIDWANGPYFIKTDTDPAGGTSYSITGTSQLLSVPYALNANTATNAWSKSGNSATATDFIGTTNDQDVVFKRNGVFYGKLNEYNLSIGQNALAVSNGIENNAFGYAALESLTTGFGNSAFGLNSLRALTIGNANSALGINTFRLLTTGDFNTAIGRRSLENLTTGSNNTGIGHQATAPNATGSNQVRIGNTQVTYAGVQVAWTITSDKRWKSNIAKSNLGLDFIKQLQPVSYTRRDVQVSDKGTKILETTSNPTVEYGFIAQELEATLNQFGAKNNGIISKDDAGMIGVRYNDLLAPMVKAIQELDTKNQALDLKNQALKQELDTKNQALELQVKSLTEKLNLVLNQVEVLKNKK